MKRARHAMYVSHSILHAPCPFPARIIGRIPVNRNLIFERRICFDCGGAAVASKLHFGGLRCCSRRLGEIPARGRPQGCRSLPPAFPPRCLAAETPVSKPYCTLSTPFAFLLCMFQAHAPLSWTGVLISRPTMHRRTP